MVVALRLVPMAAVMGTIFFLSHLPGSDLPLPGLPGIDKAGHFLAYAVLAAAVLFAWRPERRRQRPLATVALTLLFSLLYGLSDELHQTLVPGRQADLFDLLADGSGALFCCGLWLWRQRRHESGGPSGGG